MPYIPAATHTTSVAPTMSRNEIARRKRYYENLYNFGSRGAGPGGFGDSGVATKLGTAVKGVVDFFGKAQADAGAADLARAQAAQAAAAGPPSEFPIMPIVLLGGAALAAYLLLKKKK